MAFAEGTKCRQSQQAMRQGYARATVAVRGTGFDAGNKKPRAGRGWVGVAPCLWAVDRLYGGNAVYF